MEFGYLFVGLIINFGLSFIVANIAERKGRSFAGFYWLSFLLGFFIGILVVIAIPNESKPFTVFDKTVIQVKCPHCAELILAEASVCKHCGRDVNPSTELLQAAEEQKLNALRSEAFKKAENQIYNKRGHRISIAIICYIFGTMTLIWAIAVSGTLGISSLVTFGLTFIFVLTGSFALYGMPKKPGTSSFEDTTLQKFKAK